MLSLTTDGAFVPVKQLPAPARVMHFLGDSITAAHGVHGGAAGCPDSGFTSDYSANWAGILCAAFGANCSTIAVGE